MANYQSNYTGQQIDAGIADIANKLDKSGGALTGALSFTKSGTTYGNISVNNNNQLLINGSTDLILSNGSASVSVSTIENSGNKVTSWSATTTDVHYPSEKLVKDSLDTKLNSTGGTMTGNLTILNSETKSGEIILGNGLTVTGRSAGTANIQYNPPGLIINPTYPDTHSPLTFTSGTNTNTTIDGTIIPKNAILEVTDNKVTS